MHLCGRELWNKGPRSLALEGVAEAEASGQIGFRSAKKEGRSRYAEGQGTEGEKRNGVGKVEGGWKMKRRATGV